MEFVNYTVSSLSSRGILSLAQVLIKQVHASGEAKRFERVYNGRGKTIRIH